MSKQDCIWNDNSDCMKRNKDVCNCTNYQDDFCPVTGERINGAEEQEPFIEEEIEDIPLYKGEG